MPKLWTALFGTLAFLWLVETVRLLWRMADLARLCDVAPLPDAECPIVSILVAARDEAVGLPQALPTLLEPDYPHYEVIVVDDRSRDATPQTLDRFARKYNNLRVVHLAELPPGWIGKPHAMFRAFPYRIMEG